MAFTEIPDGAYARPSTFNGPLQELQDQIDAISGVSATLTTAVTDKGGQVFNVKAYGALGDGSANDTAGVKAALAAALAVKGTVLFPPGTYRIDEQLEIYNPVVLEGSGVSAEKWNENASGVTLLWVGDSNTDIIVIGATASSSFANSGFKYVEGVRIRNLSIRPGTDGESGRGILMDGSDTIFANRGFARDIVLENVHIRHTGGVGIELLGNVFNTRLHKCGVRISASSVDAFACTNSTSNVGVTRPGQVYLYDTYLRADDGWCADVFGYTYFFGGHFEGENGARLGTNSSVYGTHIEGDEVAGSVGVQIVGRHVIVQPANIERYETGLKIGDGTATRCDDYFCIIPLIQIGTNGIEVTSGGNRRGIAHVNNFLQLTGSDVVDSRGLGEFRGTLLTLDSDGPPSITGSRGSNAALASLLTKLEAQGIVTDDTTA